MMNISLLNVLSRHFIKRLPIYLTVLTFCWISPSLSKEKSTFPRTVKTVVIDAGHGGKDSGCSGKSVKEKDIALAVALKVGEYIKLNVPDVEVLYTRETDKFVELHERASFANRNSADLFISIHCNHSSASSVQGTETYVIGNNKKEANLEVARRENSVVALETNYKDNYDGFSLDDPTSDIIFSLYQNSYIKQSLKFAELIEDQFKNRAMRYSRGVKQESFLVLYKTSMPSVLIEIGFLSNKSEAQFLDSDIGQALIGSAVYRAFKDYKLYMDNRAQNGLKKSQ